MPRGDGTGPMGRGERTGRGAGFCAGYDLPGYANPVQGAGFGMGMGFGRGRGALPRGAGGGRGWRNRYFASGLPGWARFGGYGVSYGSPEPYQNPDPERAKQLLKRQAEDLQSELELIQKRLAEAEAGSSAE